MSADLKRIFMDLSEVSEVLTLAEATIQKMVRNGVFPAPRQLSDRRVGWLVREVEVWAENRPVSDLPPPLNTGKRRSANSVPLDFQGAHPA